MNAQWRTRTLGNVRTILYGTPLRARFTHGASWNVIGTALAQVLTLAQSILLAHFLGRMAYGQFGLLASTVQTFVVMGTLGAGIGATKFVAEFRDRAPETAGAMIGNSLALGLVAGTVVALAIVPSAGYLSRVLLHTASLRLPLILAAGLIPLYAVAWAQGGALQGFENFRAVAVLHTIRVTVALIATVLLTPVFGISGAIGALIIGVGATCLVGQYHLLRSCATFAVRLTFSLDRAHLGRLYRFSLPALLGTAINTPVTWLASAMLLNHPNGYDEVALLTVVHYWRLGATTVPLMLSTVTLPLFATLRVKEDKAGFCRLLRFNTCLNVCLSLSLALGVTLLSGPIMGAYGPGFSGGRSALVVMMIGSVLNAACVVFDQALLGANHALDSLLLSIIWTIVVLGCAAFALPLGALGIALAFAIGYGIRIGLALILTRRLPWPSCGVYNLDRTVTAPLN